MYVRLAFAVAAHIDPDVLLVDEVLAVGDIGFRAKCYRRMAELRANGTSVMLVSHNVDAVRDVCDRVLLLWEGELVEDGPPDSVIQTYVARIDRAEGRPASRRGGFADRTVVNEACLDRRKIEITQVVFRDDTGQAVEAVESGKPLSIEIAYTAWEVIQDPIFRVDFYHRGTAFTGYSTAVDEEPIGPVVGDGEIELRIAGVYLPPGTYTASAVISEKYEYNLLDMLHQAYALQVLRAPGTRGQVMLPHEWQHSRPDSQTREDRQRYA
jgi:hypothetical protein